MDSGSIVTIHTEHWPWGEGGGWALAAWDFNEDVDGDRGRFLGQPFDWNQIRYSMSVEVKDRVG